MEMNEDENLDNFNKVSLLQHGHNMHLHFPFSFVLKCCFKIEQQKVLKISIKLLRMCFKQMYNESRFRQTFLLNSCHVWCQRNNILTQNDARDLMLLTVF